MTFEQARQFAQREGMSVIVREAKGKYRHSVTVGFLACVAKPRNRSGVYQVFGLNGKLLHEALLPAAMAWSVHKQLQPLFQGL